MILIYAKLPEATHVWSQLQGLHCLIWYLSKTLSQGMTWYDISIASITAFWLGNNPKQICPNNDTCLVWIHKKSWMIYPSEHRAHCHWIRDNAPVAPEDLLAADPHRSCPRNSRSVDGRGNVRLRHSTIVCPLVIYHSYRKWLCIVNLPGFTY